VDDGSWKSLLDGNAAGDEIDTGAIGGVVGFTNTSYSVEIGVVDDIGNEASVTKIVPTDKVEFHLRNGGKGAAFGEYAEDENVLSVAKSWELRVKGELSVAGYEISKSNLLETIYPIGSIYMSANNVSPASFFGGTWERIQDRFLLAAGDTYSAGNTGGEATHTLTAAESGCPSHTHTASYSGADFYIRHGTTESTDSVMEGENTTVDKAVGENWANGFSTSGYSHNLDRVNIDGSVSVGESTAANASEAHNNMPPYLIVYVWQRTA
jgi:microcystin-dependent protein